MKTKTHTGDGIQKAPAAFGRLAPAYQRLTRVRPFTLRKSRTLRVTRGDAVKSAVAAIAASGSLTFVLRRMDAAIRAMALSKGIERKFSPRNVSMVASSFSVSFGNESTSASTIAGRKRGRPVSFHCDNAAITALSPVKYA